MDSQRLQLDSLRGLACLALVTFHTIGADSMSGLRVPDDDTLRLFSNALVYVRMPLFAVLSGFVYALRPVQGDVQSFIRAKVRRLVVPMLTVGTLFAIVQANTPGANFSGYDWSRLHIEPVAHYWFLESLFIVFLLVVGLERERWLAAPAPFAAAWLGAAALFVWNPLPTTLGLRGASYLLPFVLLGIACQRLGPRLGNRRAAVAAAAALFLVAAAAWPRSTSWPDRNSAIALGLGTSGCVALLHSGMRLRWLAKIGTYSFSIFLFHSVFSAASRIVLTRVFAAPFDLLLVAGIAAGVIFPVAVELAIRGMGHPLGFWLLGQKPPRRPILQPSRWAESTAALPL